LNYPMRDVDFNITLNEVTIGFFSTGQNVNNNVTALTILLDK